jgi:acyl-CoA thioesterase-1
LLIRVLAAICIVIIQWGPTAHGAEHTIIVVGDSLSSGYGLEGEPSWVALLATRLQEQGYGHEVVNASIAGDTTAGGLARLPRLLERFAPGIVIIELGGNDGLRGQPVASLKRNLSRMIEQSKAEGADIILAGIQIPPNYGPAYTEAVSAVYPELAEQYGLPLVGFFMDGVALAEDYMQSDGIHPNAAGQSILLDNVWPVLAPLL